MIPDGQSQSTGQRLGSKMVKARVVMANNIRFCSFGVRVRFRVWVDSVNRVNSVNRWVRVNGWSTAMFGSAYDAGRVDSVKLSKLSPLNKSTRRVNSVHVSTTRHVKVWQRI
ncbi:hypothetical protein Hdeb2414_s0008g00293451 [Helianthus debilis subsp. tardiflorus]